MTPRAKQSLPTFSLDGAALGVRAMIPLLPAMVGFGIAIGAAAAAKGLTFFEHVLMSLFVYAGLSQMVALEVWPLRMTAGAVLGIALVTATVNARFLLLGAAFRQWFAPLPAWQSYPLLFFMTEPGWIAAMRYRSEGGSDIGFYLGGGVFIFIFWMSSIAAGYLLGAVVPDAKLIALDLLMPVYFSAMLVPLWRGVGHAIPWVLAGVVALLMHHFVGGWWYVITGALAGIIAAGFIDERD